MKTLLTQLAEMHACDSAVQWVRSGGYKTLSAAWRACPRGDWMLWFAGKKSGDPESEGRRRLVIAACECARLALPYAKSPTVLICIETAEKWSRGEATIEQVHEARRNAAADAYAAYAAAAAAAAYAAAAADDAYAYAAYAYAAAAAAAYAYADAAAAYADARKKTLAQCADIVRKHYPRPPR